MPKTNVGAGCGVAVFNKNREFILLRRHKGLGHLPGAHCFAGGWIEMGETMLDAGRREVMEEIGCKLAAIKVVGAADVIIPEENHHNITALMVAVLADGETPKNCEPDKAEEIIFVPFSKWYAMPRPTFCDYAANMSRMEIEKFLDENIPE
jgi:8-oxo-dGTP pyrophosphatase MutT (NUDIX family)